MKFPARLFSLLAILFLMTFVACNQKGDSANTKKQQTPPKSPREMMAKSWALQKLNTNNPDISPALISSATFNFYQDGRYEIVMGTPEKGTWQLSADNKILVTTPDATQQPQEIDIEFLSDTLLIMKNETGPTPVRMELKPF